MRRRRLGSVDWLVTGSTPSARPSEGSDEPAASRARRAHRRPGRRRPEHDREHRCGGRRLGDVDGPDARAADLVGCARPLAGRRRRRRDCAGCDDVGACDGRVSGRRGCRRDARRRKRARGVRGRSGAARADEVARARAADRSPPPSGRGRGGAGRRASAGRHRGRPRRRGDSCRRCRRGRGACRRGCIDGRAAAGFLCG